MNRSAISQLYHGERGTYDSIKISYLLRKISQEMIEAEKNLKILCQNNPDIEKAYEGFMKLNNDYCAHLSEHFYIEGFKFGLRLGIESGIEEDE